MRRFLIIILCIEAFLPSSCDLFSPPRMGKVSETWETTNKIFKIRVTRRTEENGGFVAGAYYVFQSAVAGSDEWKDIMVFRHDDPNPIPREQIQFVDNLVGYIFMGWVYAITTDGGQTWFVWDAKRDLPNWECCNYSLIKEVNLAHDGTGTMMLNTIPGRQGEVPKLYTRDYGRHWNVK
jgi:hypothetical protein